MEFGTPHLFQVPSSEALEELGVEGGDELDSGHELADEIFVMGEKQVCFQGGCASRMNCIPPKSSLEQM